MTDIVRFLGKVVKSSLLLRLFSLECTKVSNQSEPRAAQPIGTRAEEKWFVPAENSIFTVKMAKRKRDEDFEIPVKG